MTRFLALFYGKFASGATDISDTAEVGLVRSGRLPYESVRELYNGFLVMAGAYHSVAQSLAETTNVYGSNQNDINSAMIYYQTGGCGQSRPEEQRATSFDRHGF